MTMSTMGDIFYDYQLKNWLQSGKTNKQSHDLYQTAVLTYLRELANFHMNRLIGPALSVDFNDSGLA
ncbi:GL25688 [Drosophila persimilis]|uniref:GL25688 n=1 Tax=Drosophila persimilis TaxID=7234 RepID=B4GKG3_DROPE|nr:GL25688 [Drosophila persimilis]